MRFDEIRQFSGRVAANGEGYAEVASLFTSFALFDVRREVQIRVEDRLMGVLLPVAEHVLRIADAGLLERPDDALGYIAKAESHRLRIAADIIGSTFLEVVGEIAEVDTFGMSVDEALYEVVPEDYRDNASFVLDYVPFSLTGDNVARILEFAGFGRFREMLTRKERKTSAMGKSRPLGLSIYGDPGDPDEALWKIEQGLVRDLLAIRPDVRYAKVLTPENGKITNLPDWLTAGWIRGQFLLQGMKFPDLEKLAENALVGKHKEAHLALIPVLDTSRYFERRGVLRVGRLAWMAYLAIEAPTGRFILLPFNGAILKTRIFDLGGFEDDVNRDFWESFQVLKFRKIEMEDGRVNVAVSYRLIEADSEDIVYRWVPSVNPYTGHERGGRMWDGRRYRQLRNGSIDKRDWGLWSVLTGIVAGLVDRYVNLAEDYIKAAEPYYRLFGLIKTFPASIGEEAFVRLITFSAGDGTLFHCMGQFPWRTEEEFTFGLFNRRLRARTNAQWDEFVRLAARYPVIGVPQWALDRLGYKGPSEDEVLYGPTKHKIVVAYESGFAMRGPAKLHHGKVASLVPVGMGRPVVLANGVKGYFMWFDAVKDEALPVYKDGKRQHEIPADGDWKVVCLTKVRGRIPCFIRL